MRPLIVLLPFADELVGTWVAIVIAVSWAIVLAFAVTALLNLVQSLRPFVPPFARAVYDAITGVLVHLHDWAYSRAEAQLAPITNAIRHWDNRIRNYMRANAGVHQATLAALRRIRFDVIPAVEVALIGFVQERIAAVIAFTILAVDHTRAQVAAELAALQQFTVLAVDHTRALLAQEAAQRRQDDQLVIGYAQALTAQAITRADQELARALQAAYLEDAAIAAYARTLAGDVVAYAQQLVAQEQRRADAEVAQVTQYAQSVGFAVLTLVLPQLQALTQRVKAIEDSPCQQECRTLGQLGQNLDGLDLAALLAWLLGAAEHPKEAAGAVAGTLTPGANLVSAQLLGLFK